jgi:hypothetical protein
VSDVLGQSVPVATPAPSGHRKVSTGWRWWLLALVVVGLGLVGTAAFHAAASIPTPCAGPPTPTTSTSSSNGINLRGGDIGRAIVIDDGGIPVRVTLERAVNEIPIVHSSIQPTFLLTNKCPYLGVLVSLRNVGTSPAPLTTVTHQGAATTEIDVLSLVINVAHGSSVDNCSSASTPLGPSLLCNSAGPQTIPPGETITGWYVIQPLSTSLVSVEIQLGRHFGLWKLPCAGCGTALKAIPTTGIPTTSSTSTATERIPASSPIGNYLATVLGPEAGGSIPGEAPETLSLTVSSNGSFRFAKGDSGSWTESGGVLTMTADSFVFKVTQIGENLGSAANPGDVTADGAQLETWYAIRR